MKTAQAIKFCLDYHAAKPSPRYTKRLEYCIQIQNITPNKRLFLPIIHMLE